MIITREGDEDSRFEFRLEFNEALERVYGLGKTYVGYVSFNALRRHTTTCLNSYNVISIFLRQRGFPFGAVDRIGAALVPRKSKDDLVQTTKVTTDFSEFWDDENHFRPTFTIEHDSESIKILWRPNN